MGVAPGSSGTPRDTVPLITESPEGRVVGTDRHTLWEIALHCEVVYCLPSSIGDIGADCITSTIGGVLTGIRRLRRAVGHTAPVQVILK